MRERDGEIRQTRASSRFSKTANYIIKVCISQEAPARVAKPLTSQN